MNLKKTVRSLFPQLVDLRNRIYNDIAHAHFKNLPLKDVFSKIHKENHWRSNDSISGTGSDYKQTTEVRNILNETFSKYKIITMLDIPCGDFNWMKDVQFPEGMIYFGSDIVDDLIVTNQNKYGTDTKIFLFGDITSSALPKVDLVFCRDCLVHLSYESINNAISNLKKSGSKYILTTTFTNHVNRNIISGNWRPINLQDKPFAFPPAIENFNEHCTEDERYTDKSLALWRIQDL